MNAYKLSSLCMETYALDEFRFLMTSCMHCPPIRLLFWVVAELVCLVYMRIYNWLISVNMHSSYLFAKRAEVDAGMVEWGKQSLAHNTHNKKKYF